MKHAQAEDHFAVADAVAGASRSGPYEAAGKRAFDVLFALAIAPFVAPVILVLAALVSAGDGAAPFFGHNRVGRDGRAFRCWKIRTMVPDAQARLEAHLARDARAAEEWRLYRKLSDDPRITRIGDFLRRTSLDELPQLWNVLRGEMSFVGPRPVMADELDDHYGPARAAYCASRPGITGLWQVSGRNELSYDERVALDVDYTERMTLGLDVWIILRTAAVILRPTGR